MDLEELADEVVAIHSAHHLISYPEMHAKINEKAGRELSHNEMGDVLLRATELYMESRGE